MEGISPGIVQADEPWPSRLCSQAVVFRKADELKKSPQYWEETGKSGFRPFFAPFFGCPIFRYTIDTPIWRLKIGKLRLDLKRPWISDRFRYGHPHSYTNTKLDMWVFDGIPR